jgi:hypothetical protein
LTIIEPNGVVYVWDLIGERNLVIGLELDGELVPCRATFAMQVGSGHREGRPRRPLCWNGGA